MTTSELMRHPSAGSALLGIMRHARSHIVTSDARMAHPGGRSSCEVRPHAGSHCDGSLIRGEYVLLCIGGLVVKAPRRFEEETRIARRALASRRGSMRYHNIASR
jgi:hypothetical protein